MSKRGRSLSKEAQLLAYNVIQFVDNEKMGLKISNKKTTERASKMLKLSKPMICKIRREGSNAEAKGKTLSPRKMRSGGRNKYEIDDMNKCVITQKLKKNKYYEIHKEIPTLRKMHNFCKLELNFQALKETLRKIVLSMGFKFKKCKDKRLILCEREDIIAKRAFYLRFLNNNEISEKRPAVYVDETWIHTHYTVKKCWPSDRVGGVYTDSSVGKRLIVVHAGGEIGFIPGALLLYDSERKDGDFHSEMNSAFFFKYDQQFLIPNVLERSIVVLDNALYHNKQINKPPSSSALKANIQLWLQDRGIPYDPDLRKAELVALVKQHNPRTTFKIDKIINDKGFLTLRLPPYHPDLNPIELIWNLVKSKIKDRNMSSVSLTVLKDTSFEVFSSVNANDWTKAVEHVKHISENYWKNDSLIEDEMEDIVIRRGIHSDSSDTSDTETSPGTFDSSGSSTESASEYIHFDSSTDSASKVVNEENKIF